MITSCDHVDPEVEKLLGNLWSYAESASRILAVRNAKIDRVLLHQRREVVAQNSAARPPKDVTNKQYPQSLSSF
jgi:hypothetical protein